MRAFLNRCLAWLIDHGLYFFVAFITGIRPKFEGALDFTPEKKVYFANHGSHGDFVMVWISLPKRWRRLARPVAGAGPPARCASPPRPSVVAAAPHRPPSPGADLAGPRPVQFPYQFHTMGRNPSGVAAHRRRYAVGASACKECWCESQGMWWGRIASAFIFPGSGHYLGCSTLRNVVRTCEYIRALRLALRRSGKRKMNKI